MHRTLQKSLFTCCCTSSLGQYLAHQRGLTLQCFSMSASCPCQRHSSPPLLGCPRLPFLGTLLQQATSLCRNAWPLVTGLGKGFAAAVLPPFLHAFVDYKYSAAVRSCTFSSELSSLPFAYSFAPSSPLYIPC
jgi:hypothetical protein